MALHRNPVFNHENIRDALEEHNFPADKPSQLADAFRLGWVAAMKAVRDQDRCNAFRRQA